jgi:uncharacterized membrane protein HdeD (DUF308 family)
LIAASGAIAVRWPADGLVLGMLVVGALAALFGIVDIVVSLSHVRTITRWWALLLHGALCVVFGAISAYALALSKESMAVVFAAWLGLLGVIALAAAMTAHGRRSFTIIGFTIFSASLVSIAIVLADRQLSEFALLYVGAAYAALLGFSEMGLGRWLRHGTIVRLTSQDVV